MISKRLGDKVLKYYEEYKEVYNKHNIIGIIPCECDTDTMLAHTNNEELMGCIKNGSDVTLYVSPKFMLCSEQYIKAVLFHEFTHISDAYNFAGYDNSNFLMSTYSEYNAMKIEIVQRFKNEIVTLDKLVCGEKGNTTLREEIKDTLDNVLMIPKMTEDARKELLRQGKDGMLFVFFIKNLSYLLAYISFIENVEKEYFQNCFKQLEEYGLCEIVKKIYSNVQSLDEILDNPNLIIMQIIEIYYMFFEEL